MPPHLFLQFLGPPQIRLDDAPIFPKRRTVIALLAYLALNPQRHSREFLSSLFWSQYNQTKAFTNLRHTLWEIHKSIGEEWIISDRTTVGINQATDISLDVTCFRDSLHEARRQTDIPLRISLLADTVKIYQNHFLTGFRLKASPDFNEWVFIQSEYLREELTSALTMLVESYCILEQPKFAIQYARRLITADPLNENAYCQLMMVYLSTGRFVAALKQCQACKQIIKHEFGINPKLKTCDLHQKMLEGEPIHNQFPETVK